VPSSSGRGLGDGEKKEKEKEKEKERKKERREGFKVRYGRKKTHGGGTMGFRYQIKFGVT